MGHPLGPGTLGVAWEQVLLLRTEARGWAGGLVSWVLGGGDKAPQRLFRDECLQHFPAVTGLGVWSICSVTHVLLWNFPGPQPASETTSWDMSLFPPTDAHFLLRVSSPKIRRHLRGINFSEASFPRAK